MNTLIKKEIRLLLPGLLTGVLAAIGFAIISLVLSENDFGELQPWYFLLALLFLALWSFGQEFAHGTFPVLLAQPISRKRIWRVKSLTLAGMVLLQWGFLWGLRAILPYSRDPGAWLHLYSHWYFWIFSALGALAICSGALWSVLLFRQVAPAIFVTALTPVCLFGMIETILHHQAKMIVDWVLGGAFFVYGCGGIFFARWLFLRAQDAQWGGGAVTLPWVGLLTRAGAGERRNWKPLSALLRKEIQLYHPQLLMAGGLAFLHLGVLAIRKYYPSELNSDVKALLEVFWLLWIFPALLISCSAVAEERRTGTLQAQLCLPIKRRLQFEVKFCVALILAIALGIGMPLLLEGKRILPDCEPWYNSYWFFALGPQPGFWGQFGVILLGSIFTNPLWVPLLAVGIGLVVISFYASTLARNTLEALALFVGGIVLTLFLLKVGSFPEAFLIGRLWRGPLIFFFGVPILGGTVVLLAHWNSQRGILGWKAWRRNLCALGSAVALASLGTSLTYHRVWELFGPIEPAPGPARIPAATSAALSPSMNLVHGGWITSLMVVLPDGRVWADHFNYRLTLSLDLKLVEDPIYGAGRFLEGKNWKEAMFCWSHRGNGQELDILALQRDGSLWISEAECSDSFWSITCRPRSLLHPKFVRIRSENQWKLFLGNSHLLLKNDGTLWQLPLRSPETSEEKPGSDRSIAPRQLGNSADWVEPFYLDNSAGCRKADGELWVLDSSYRSGRAPKVPIQVIGGLDFRREAALEKTLCKRVFTCESNFGGSFLAGIGDDGAFRELALPHVGAPSSAPGNFQDIQIGAETNWVKMACAPYGQPVTLKADGTLWRWNLKLPPRCQSGRVSATQLGSRSDWVSVVSDQRDEFVALAADGTLWRWRFEPSLSRYGGSRGLLRQSRRPEYLGNIFSSSH